jgi:molybdate transport system substrate-binding protein
MGAARATFTAAVAIAGLAAAIGGCGSSSKKTSAEVSQGAPRSQPTRSEPTVYAAASLTKAFPQIEPGARYMFGGSGALETQIEQGAPADVFAAASPKQPAQLFARGMVERPVEFATNQLVLIVPWSNPAHITSVSDITRRGVKLVICNATVPCGDYARGAFKHLGITAAAMKHVVSQATDVTQVVAEVALGQADAGFVYITDADAANGRVAVVGLPAKAKPSTADFIAVVKAAKNREAAESFVQRVLSARGQAVLRADGFGKP